MEGLEMVEAVLFEGGMRAGQLLGRVGAFHGEQVAAIKEEGRGLGGEHGEVGDRAGDDGVEGGGWWVRGSSPEGLSHKGGLSNKRGIFYKGVRVKVIFGPAMEDLGAGEGQLAERRAQEGRPLGSRFAQGQMESRDRDLDGDARQARARAQVHQAKIIGLAHQLPY